MLDQEITFGDAEGFRKSDPDFARKLFTGYRKGDGKPLADLIVLSIADEQPDEAIFVSARQGVYVQIGQRPSPDYRRLFIFYDGRTEPVYSVDENVPPEAWDKWRGDG